MKTIALILMVAVLLEGLVEYGKTIMYMVEDEEYKTAITQGITIVLGVLLSFVFHLQLFNGALTETYAGLQINAVIDTILTGIIISRGSNYVSDFVTRLVKGKKTTEDDDVDDDDESEEWYEFADEGEAE